MTTGVFFDLGGTLFSYRNLPRATVPLLDETVRRLGIQRDAAAVRRAYTDAGRAAGEAFADRHYYLHRDYFIETFERFLDLIEAPREAGLNDWFIEAHRTAIVDCLVLKDDCVATLRALKDAGLYLSVVSNIDDDMLEPLVEREGLDLHFDHWTSSEAAGSCKPHEGFFRHALELSGLEASEVLFVGDSPEHDIVGANAVGMRTALISDGGMEPPLQTGRGAAEPDHTIEQLGELTRLLLG